MFRVIRQQQVSTIGPVTIAKTDCNNSEWVNIQKASRNTRDRGDATYSVNSG